MAVTANSLVSPQTPNRDVVRFVGTTDAAGVAKSLSVAGANGSDVNALYVTNGATAHAVSVLILNSATTYTANVVTVAVNSGQNGTALPVNMLSPAVWPGLPFDGNGNPFLRLEPGDTLELSYATAQGTADTIYAFATRSDY